MTAPRTEAARAFVELFSCKLLLRGISSPRHCTKPKPELKKELGVSTTPFLWDSPGLWSLRGHKAPPLDRTLGWRETAERCGGSNVALNPSEIPAGGISWRSSSSQVLSTTRFLMASEASAAGKECQLLSDTLNSNKNWPRLVLGLCWSQG